MLESQSRIALRQAEASDAWDLAQLRFASLVEMGAMEPREREAFGRRAAAEISNLFREGSLAAWLLIVDGEAAGCACAIFWKRLPYPESSLHAEIAGVYVAPWLRRQGHAKQLVRKAVDFARARGARKIVLTPTDVGRSLYRGLGFKDEGLMTYRPDVAVTSRGTTSRAG